MPTYLSLAFLQGWSKGTLLLFALLAARLPATPMSYLSSLPLDLLDGHATARSHLRSVILFNPPSVTFGGAFTPDMLAALAPVLPPNTPTPLQFGVAFADWAASASGDASQLGPNSFADVVALIGPEAAQVDRAQATSAWGLAASAQEAGEVARAGVKAAEWPVGLVYGSHSVGTCLEGVGRMLEWCEEARREGKAEQPSGVRVIEGGTHFAPVLKPKEFVAEVVGLVEELRPIVRWF